MLFGMCWAVVIDTNVTKNKISYRECLMRTGIASISFLVSNTQVFIISLDRVCTICFKVRFFIKNRNICTVLSVVLSWTFSFILIVLLTLFRSQDNGGDECSLSRIFPDDFPLLPFIFILLEVGTLINISWLVIYLIRHHRKMQTLTVRKVGRDDVRLCITIGIVTSVCTFLHIPWNITTIYGILIEWPSRFIRNSAFFLSALTSIINPIIYIFRVQKFRQLLQNSIRC